MSPEGIDRHIVAASGPFTFSLVGLLLEQLEHAPRIAHMGPVTYRVVNALAHQDGLVKKTGHIQNLEGFTIERHDEMDNRLDGGLIVFETDSVDRNDWGVLRGFQVAIEHYEGSV